MGAQEMLLLALFALAFVWPAWRICSKAGFPGPLGLVGLIPGGILVLLFVWAFVDWPALRAGTPASISPDGKTRTA